MPVALLVVLVVAAALLVDWYNSPRNGTQSNPAIVAPEVATPGPSPALSVPNSKADLFTATFAEADLPTGEVEVIFYRLTLDPGARMTQLTGPYCGCGGESLLSGVGIETVVSGSYQLQSGASMRIRRAGSDVDEEVSAGTEATLGPGDSVVHLDYAAAGAFQNMGNETVVVIGVAIVEGESAVGTPVPALPDGARPEQLSRAISRDWEIVAAGPVTVSLRRTFLDPGESWPAEEPNGLETIHVESGQIDLALIPVGEDVPATLPLRHAQGRTTLFSALGEGVRRSIENTGDVPAILLVLTVGPGLSGPSTPELS